MIGEFPDIEIVATTDGLDATVRSVKGHSPNVILYVVALPTTADAISEQIRTLADVSPDSAIVVLNASESATVARAALHAGAAGYILKSELPAVMSTALHRAAEGQHWVSPRVTSAITKLNREPAREELSPRQQTIVRSIAWGHTSKEIAVELNLSRRTIEASRADILQKLGVSSRASIVKYAIDRGLFDEDDAMAVPPPPIRGAR